MFKNIFKSRIALLYLLSISLVFAFSAWISLLNNFVIEVASFDGSQIGFLQSIREIPGFLSFSIIFVLIFISQQKLAYISMILLGLAVAFTGIFPTPLGLYTTTVIMSLGFHYLATINQSLSLQWLDKKTSPATLGKITAANSFTKLLVLASIFLMMKFYSMEYKYVYLIFGGITALLGIFAWIFFEHFKDDVIQENRLKIKKEYWLFYVLTFFAGARRQIFIVFASFLLVQKFGVSIENMLILLFANSVLNIYLAPKIGRYIVKFGERLALRVEYIGLIIIFTSYAFVNDVNIAYLLYICDHLLFSMAIALKTYFQKIANPKDLASASAISFTINHVAAVFLPFILGIIWLWSSSLVFIIGTSIAVCSFALSFLIPKNPHPGNETTLVKI